MIHLLFFKFVKNSNNDNKALNKSDERKEIKSILTFN